MKARVCIPPSAGRRWATRFAALRFAGLLGPARGQALLETALAIPVILLLIFGVVSAGQLTRAKMGVSAVARESARASALAESPSQAEALGTNRGYEIAEGYGLDARSLRVEVQASGLRPGGEVSATASYELSFRDLPLLGWTSVRLTSSHREPVDPYRSRPTGADTP